MRILLTLPVIAVLTGCYANPAATPEWPVMVAPAAGQPNRMVAIPPECGPAPATIEKLYGSSWHNPYLGLGCSQARNLAVQIEEPHDLLTGRSLGPADAERQSLAIQNYRNGEEKDLMREGTRSSFGSSGGGE